MVYLPVVVVLVCCPSIQAIYSETERLPRATQGGPPRPSRYLSVFHLILFTFFAFIHDFLFHFMYIFNHEIIMMI